MSLASRLLPIVLCLAAHPLAGAAQSTLSGRLIPADGGPVHGMRVYLRSPAGSDTVAVDSAGRFSLPLPASAGSRPVELVADAADPRERPYHPAIAPVPRTTWAAEQRVVLVPHRWTVRGGRFAGTEVGVSLDRAFQQACSRCTGFYRYEAQRGSFDRIMSWPQGVFPLRTAFDRDESGEPISPRDSASFWRVVDELESDYGADLFRPVPYYQTLALTDPVQDVVLVQVEPPLRYAGLGLVMSQAGDIVAGAVWVKRSASFGETELLHHELMHTLGFGHTCAWRSVLADVRRCPQMDSPRLTAEDVAHAQLLQHVRSLQREHGAPWGMESALAGEREVERARS